MDPAAATEPTAVDWWALAFAVAATAAAAVAAIWAWVDRPQRTWWYRIAIDREDPKCRDIEIHASGAPMYAAKLEVYGCKLKGERAERALGKPLLAVGSDPLHVEIELDDDDGTGAFLIITWIRPRPLTHLGCRLHLGTGLQELWRWYWRSLEVRRPCGVPWWHAHKYRPVRTRGRWVTWAGAPPVTIPDVTPISSAL